jgi:hypothetical protein
MSQKRIFLTLLVILGAVAISGCGNKNVSNTTDITKSTSPEVSGKTQEKENLPAPTGNINDVINSVNSEANGETDIVSGEEDDAKNAVSDKEEADNFGATYDENEF